MSPEIFRTIDQISQIRYEQVGPQAKDVMGLKHDPNILLLKPNTFNPFLGGKSELGNSSDIVGESPQELSTQEMFMAQHVDHYLSQVLNRAPHEFAGKSIGIAVPFAGWGHLIQAAGLSQRLTRVGHFNVVMGDIVDSLPENKAYPYRLIQKFLKVHQTGEDVQGFIEGIRRWDKNVPVGENINRQFASYLFQIALSGAGIDQSDGALSKFSANIANRLKGNKTAMSLLFKFINGADSYSTERQLAWGVSKWKDIYGLSALLSTHASPVRSSVFIKNKDRLPSVAFVPDDGYGFDPTAAPDDLIAHYQGLIPFAPTPLEGKNSGNVYTYANKGIVDAVTSLLNPHSHATEIGTLSSSITAEEFISKWQQPHRNILLSSNGTGTNLEEIADQVEEIYHAIKQGRDTSGYTFQVFIGNNLGVAPARLKELMGLIENDDISNFDFIITQDQSSTVFLKDEYTKKAHVQIRSPGENALDNGNMGCAAITTFINAPHERSNLYHMMLKGGAFPATYPASSFKGWQEFFANIPEGKRPKHNMDYFTESAPDFLAYLDSITGRTVAGDEIKFRSDSLIQDVATNGFINSDPNAQLHAMLILYQLLINYEDGIADVSQEQLDKIKTYMVHVRAISKQEREEKLKASSFKASVEVPV